MSYGNEIYPELREWILRRMGEPNNYSPWRHGNGVEMCPTIGFGRQKGHTWAILKFMIETYNEMPPVLYCTYHGLNTTNPILGNMIRAGEVSETDAIAMRPFISSHGTLCRSIHTQILQPSVIILDRGIKLNHNHDTTMSALPNTLKVVIG